MRSLSLWKPYDCGTVINVSLTGMTGWNHENRNGAYSFALGW